jgi:hypothetical protein
MHNRFRHYICHRSFHQLIEMGHNFSKGKRLKEIEFGDDAQHFHDRKGVEIMLSRKVTLRSLMCNCPTALLRADRVKMG